MWVFTNSSIDSVVAYKYFLKSYGGCCVSRYLLDQSSFTTFSLDVETLCICSQMMDSVEGYQVSRFCIYLFYISKHLVYYIKPMRNQQYCQGVSCANFIFSINFLILLLFLLLQSFSHQRQLMVFPWSFSDRESPQVSRTLLNILAVFNNAVIWMVSTRPPTSKSSRPFNNLLVTVPKAPIAIDTIVTLMFHSFFFNSLTKSRYLFFFSHSFSSILWSAGTVKSTILLVLFFFFFFDYYKVWSSVRDQVIRVYIKVPSEFMCVIFQDRCWVVHIPFVLMFKFKFLAHFPQDHHAYPVVSSLVLFLC